MAGVAMQRYRYAWGDACWSMHLIIDALRISDSELRSRDTYSGIPGHGSSDKLVMTV
jgi:hypothetical protein